MVTIEQITKEIEERKGLAKIEIINKESRKDLVIRKFKETFGKDPTDEQIAADILFLENCEKRRNGALQHVADT